MLNHVGLKNKCVKMGETPVQLFILMENEQPLLTQFEDVYQTSDAKTVLEMHLPQLLEESERVVSHFASATF